jgi:hypothetical protein
MMLCNIPVRRMALRDWPAHDPSRETFVSFFRPTRRPKPKAKAEGATTPETLRQTDRDRVMNFWKVKQIPLQV